MVKLRARNLLIDAGYEAVGNEDAATKERVSNV